MKKVERNMTIEIVPISSLSEDPANARRHGKRNLDQVKASLRRFGQQKPIVVDATNTVRAGNGTLAAAKALGWEMIQIVRSDLPRTELTAYAIADNRSAELADWDDKVLAATLADPEIGDVGFLDEEIAKLTKDAELDEPEAELPAEQWMVLVTCKDEAEQAELLERFAQDGLTCKALVG
jgi:ParB-like chromosome segregation protein Spo0J